MTDEKVKQKARELIRKSYCSERWIVGESPIVDTLAAANLLHDPEEVERGKAALDACVDAANTGMMIHGFAYEEVYRIGRAELELRKPKVRWTLRQDGALVVCFDGGATGRHFPNDAEPEARAYVARKNAEEAK